MAISTPPASTCGSRRTDGIGGGRAGYTSAFSSPKTAPAGAHAPPPQTVLPVADVLAVGQGYTIALHAVADPAEAGRHNQPRAGFRQVAFEVTVTNTGSAPLGNNAGGFQVVASSGPGHLVFAWGVEPQLETAGLGPGASTRGWVTFHVETFAVLAGLTYTLLATTSSVTFALR